MRQFGWIAIVVVAVLAGGGRARALDLARDGAAAAVIVLPETANVSERHAAESLVKYIKAISGAELSVLHEPAALPADRAAVSIGNTKLAASARMTDDGLRWDGYRLRVAGNVLYVRGRDVAPPTGAAPYIRDGVQGTWKASMALLERLGVRWLQPGPQGTFIPQLKTVSVPNDLDVTTNPPFMYALFGRAGWEDWQEANNFRVAVNLYTVGGHTWPEFVPTSLWDTHPEYFRMENGKRIKPTVPYLDYLCPSNPDVIKLLAEGVAKRFDQGYDLVQLAQSDGYQACQCDVCRALDQPGEIQEQVHQAHFKVIEMLAKTHPGKQVQMLIYPPTNVPSRHIDQYPNTVLEVCNTDESTLKLWHGKTTAGLTTYVYYMGPPSMTGLAPRFTPKMASDEICKLARNGVTGIYFCGGGENWGGEGPTYYTIGRMLGDPTLDWQDVLGDYCRFTFGKAGDTMIGFYKLWYSRIEGAPKFETEETFTSEYAPAVMERLESMLQLAKSQANGDARASGWIRLAELSLKHAGHIARVYQLSTAYQANRTFENLAQVRDAVAAHNAFSDWIVAMGSTDAAFVRDFFLGWDFAWAGADYFGPLRTNASSLNAPFMWDFDAIFANKVLPGKSRPNAVVARLATPPAIDGDIDDAVWKDVPWQSLSQVSLGKVEAATRFRLAHDDKNFYVAVEAQEPLYDRMVISPYGHDGEIYGTECIELFFDPECGERKMMHLIASPTETGTYDARSGYIDDPTNPLVIEGREDKSWEPKWRHAFKLNPGSKTWTMEFVVPFASLDAGVPAEGQRWRFNLGRERMPSNFKGGKEGGVDLYLWSPNLQTPKFCEPAILGDIYFGKAPDTK